MTTNAIKNLFGTIGTNPKFAHLYNRLTYFKSIKSFCLQHRYNKIVKEKYYIGTVMVNLPSTKNAFLTAITKISQEMGNSFGKQRINCQAMTWDTGYAKEWFFIKTPMLNLRFCLIERNLMEVQFYATKRAYKANLFEKGRLFKSLKADIKVIHDDINTIQSLCAAE